MFVDKIDVTKLEIDLPISELEVQQKVESMRTNGLIQPITVWLGSEANGWTMRVIDGFHRLEAARRMGKSQLTFFM